VVPANTSISALSCSRPRTLVAQAGSSASLIVPCGPQVAELLSELETSYYSTDAILED
jgi:hypothetical protein